MDAERFFLEQFPTIERAIAFACRRARLYDADAEDFRSTVHLRLIEHDYAIIRAFANRCTFATYIAVVVQRLLCDHRNRVFGKWRASAEAKRLGVQAVQLEQLVARDKLPLTRAIDVLLSSDPTADRQNLELIARRLPERVQRPRTVSTEDLPAGFVESELPEDDYGRREAALEAVTASKVIRTAIDELPEDDRVLFRLRYEAGLTVAQIARSLHLDQKLTYKRMEKRLRHFRRRLEEHGIHVDQALGIIGNTNADLDFGFRSEPEDLPPLEERR